MSYRVLEGWRVVDLGIVTAGASTSAVLADLGAEVIKVEGPHYTDPFREWTGVNFDSEWWNESAQFQATNRNKLSACIDLKRPEGTRLLLDLVAMADVVLENFRYGVLERLGIPFERLAAANPKIVLASISSQGQTGPDRDKSSFGSTLEASSGMAALMRYPGGRPQITGRGMNYPDQVASLFSASAVIAALIEARRGGRAIHVDLSQRELTAFLIAEELVAAGARRGAPAAEQGAGAGTPGQRDGADSATEAAGADREGAASEGNAGEGNAGEGIAGETSGVHAANDGLWVAVTAGRDALARVPGGAAGLAGWIARQRAQDAACALREMGAAAEVVWTAGRSELDAWPALADAFATDDCGRQVKGLPLRIGAEGPGTFRAAPPLGRDNRYVACEILGLGEEEYGRLCADGIFADRPSKARRR
ncbi:CoA transferase [Pigmentiphaga soli]|uniref:CoA transferase n=1 Tax=Pigmentiphaga soli TaxID=1007095 RepID=A0ABP8H8S4_9BURK